MLRNYEVKIIRNVLVKFRGVWVITGGLLFNLVSSLLVWHPPGVHFNRVPMTITEWVCDIISVVIGLFGLVVIFYDINMDSKKKIKEALLEANDEIKGR